ncbi:MAG: hypothetical protein ACQETH_12435 [Candidatus Rifleibacteriota bacterium]
MKFLSKLCLILMAFFIFASSYPAICAEATVEEAEEEEETIPDSTDMTLDVTDDEYVMEEGFRGSEEGDGDLQWLEDVGYLMQENSDLYNVDAGAIAEAAEFEGEPNINWEVQKEEDDGNMNTESSDNTNQATNESNITSPGYYQVHNGGARRVSSDSGAEGCEEGSGSGDGTTSTTGDDSEDDGASGDGDGTATASTDDEDEEGESKTVTAQQRVGIKVHDCTSPDIWVAFQEGAGSVDIAATEEELKANMVNKILDNQGRPFSTDPDDYADASYIFIEEGKEDERDSIPWEKSARLSIAGPLFNDKGALKFESGVLPSQIDQNNYTNHVEIAGGEDKALKGVYVRRNVPFIFAAVSTDNGNERATAGVAEAKIVYADGEEVEKNGEGYLFRVPNYPREQYQDQPEYYFVTTAADKDGNLSTMQMPLYVVDTRSSFEGGQNR